MTRACFVLMTTLPFCLTSCNSVSLGGSDDDGGGPPEAGSTPTGGTSGVGGSGGNGGTVSFDAPVQGGQGGGGTGGTALCSPRNFDVDCAFGVATYTCVARASGSEWTYSCPDAPTDGGTIFSTQHPYVSTGAACIDYPVSGYRVFPYAPSLRANRTWPACTLNCTTITPSYGPTGLPPLDQALPAGPCDDEGATCDGPTMTGWCPPCADVGGPGNGYTCICHGHNWQCAVTSPGMNQCGGPTCLDPSRIAPNGPTCGTTTWTDKQVCQCGVCRDLCDSDDQCSSGRCKLNQVCRPSSDTCAGIEECPAPCRGLCEPTTLDGGSTDSSSATGCDLAAAAQAVSAAGMTTVGEAQTVNVDLPSSLSSSADWGVKDVECRAGGYDLSVVAGKSVCLASFAITDLCQQQSTNAWVVMSEGTVRCIYKAVRPDSPMTPGVYSVHDSACSTPDGGSASCPGPNPAARTCRTTASECIPSSCTCGAAGSSASTWGCTADCRALPLCALDGGTAG